MTEYGSAGRHPFTSFILLLLLIFAGMVSFTLLGFLISIPLYGTGPLIDIVNQRPNGDINFLKLLQIVVSIGMFIVPALVFARLEKKDWLGYLKLNRTLPLVLAVVAIAIMLSAIPLIDYTAELNQKMKLPGFLKAIEDWMKAKENEAALLTEQLLAMKTYGVLALNLFMIAVIPAIGEELIFRGCLQKLLYKGTKNYHLAIWLAAIVFSAIHVQFYGFIPRMLLGALFGYLFYWSKTLWVPILAHFINNGVAVITAFVYQKQGIPLNKLDQTSGAPGYAYLLSFISTVFLIYFFYRITVNYQNKNNGARLD